MTRIISAQSILKQKGYVQNKFDTNGFINAVGQFFLDNGVEDKLLLIPYRFLDIEKVTYRDLGFEREGVDMDEVVVRRNNPYDVTAEEEKVGFKVQTEKDKDGDLVYGRKMLRIDFDKFRAQQEAGLLVPRIIVDKPFFENAAGMLRVMGGYVVEKQMKKRKKYYWVTLV